MTRNSRSRLLCCFFLVGCCFTGGSLAAQDSSPASLVDRLEPFRHVRLEMNEKTGGYDIDFYSEAAFEPLARLQQHRLATIQNYGDKDREFNEQLTAFVSQIDWVKRLETVVSEDASGQSAPQEAIDNPRLRLERSSDPEAATDETFSQLLADLTESRTINFMDQYGRNGNTLEGKERRAAMMQQVLSGLLNPGLRGYLVPLNQDQFRKLINEAELKTFETLKAQQTELNQLQQECLNILNSPPIALYDVVSVHADYLELRQPELPQQVVLIPMAKVNRFTLHADQPDAQK